MARRQWHHDNDDNLPDDPGASGSSRHEGDEPEGWQPDEEDDESELGEADMGLGDQDESRTTPCPSCGQDIWELARRCPECGVHFAGEAWQGQLAGDKPRQRLWIVLTALLLLAAGAVAFWWSWRMW